MTTRVVFISRFYHGFINFSVIPEEKFDDYFVNKTCSRWDRNLVKETEPDELKKITDHEIFLSVDDNKFVIPWTWRCILPEGDYDTPIRKLTYKNDVLQYNFYKATDYDGSFENSNELHKRLVEMYTSQSPDFLLCHKTSATNENLICEFCLVNPIYFRQYRGRHSINEIIMMSDPYFHRLHSDETPTTVNESDQFICNGFTFYAKELVGTIQLRGSLRSSTILNKYHYYKITVKHPGARSPSVNDSVQLSSAHRTLIAHYKLVQDLANYDLQSTLVKSTQLNLDELFKTNHRIIVHNQKRFYCPFCGSLECELKPFMITDSFFVLRHEQQDINVEQSAKNDTETEIKPRDKLCNNGLVLALGKSIEYSKNVLGTGEVFHTLVFMNDSPTGGFVSTFMSEFTWKHPETIKDPSKWICITEKDCTCNQDLLLNDVQ
jgi:hypothetical protein